MDKETFIREVAYRSDVPREKARVIIKNLEELVLELIALEDSVSFKFGKVGGVTRPPKRVFGFCRRPEICNGEWSKARFGYPFVKWTEEALDCKVQNGTDYLNENGLMLEWKKKYYKPHKGDVIEELLEDTEETANEEN